MPYAFFVPQVFGPLPPSESQVEVAQRSGWLEQPRLPSAPVSQEELEGLAARCGRVGWDLVQGLGRVWGASDFGCGWGRGGGGGAVASFIRENRFRTCTKEAKLSDTPRIKVTPYWNLY